MKGVDEAHPLLFMSSHKREPYLPGPLPIPGHGIDMVGPFTNVEPCGRVTAGHTQIKYPRIVLEASLSSACIDPRIWIERERGREEGRQRIAAGCDMHHM